MSLGILYENNCLENLEGLAKFIVKGPYKVWK